MSGERERREDRAWADGDLWERPTPSFAADPAQRQEEQAHQERLAAESLSLEVEQLADVPGAAWATRKAALDQRLARLRARMTSSAGGSTARVERERGLAAAALTAAAAGLARATRPSTVADEREGEIAPALAAKTLSAAELLDWFAALPAA
ncbi:MAG TPA: hypothetical protein VHE35_00755, partial [Kofleriaceae bacterium]|nr:hypothetical protein [Kofleriaceae bacterium]